MSSMQIWVNGLETEVLSALDRGLAYGDGLFETLLVEDGRIRLETYHRRRLLLGAERMGMPVAALVEQSFRELATIVGDRPGTFVAKLILTRGVGGRGYLAPEAPEYTRILQLGNLPDWEQRQALAQSGVRVRFCTTQLGLAPHLAGIKHLNRIEQVMARSEWSDPSIHEGIVCNIQGQLVEATMSNLFWVSEGQVFTPDLNSCGVKGVVREFIVERLVAKGMPVIVGEFGPDALYTANEVFLTNSINGCWPVIQLGQRSLTIGPVARLVQELLLEEYQR